MSEEGESINENINQSSEEETPGVSEYERDLGTEEEGERTGETATEEISATEQPLPSQLEVQAKPKRQKPKVKTVNKIQKTLEDTSNQLVKQRTQINRINQNLQSLQKQAKTGEKQVGIVNQIRSQINQIQRQIIEVHKTVPKRPTSKFQSSKKVSRNKKKSKK
jgi:small-conductance mechanosensitive channel